MMGARSKDVELMTADVWEDATVSAHQGVRGWKTVSDTGFRGIALAQTDSALSGRVVSDPSRSVTKSVNCRSE